MSCSQSGLLGNAEDGQERVEQAVLLEDVPPHDGDCDHTGDDRRVEHRPEERVEVLGSLVEGHREREGDRHGDRQADEHEDSGDAQRVQEAAVVEQGDVLVQSDEVDVERGAEVLGGDVGEGHRHRGQEGDPA